MRFQAGVRAAGPVVFSLLLTFAAGAQPAPGPSGLSADDTAAAQVALADARARLLADDALPLPDRLHGLIRLGLWDEAETLIGNAPAEDPDVRAAEALLRFKQHRYADADRLADAVLRRDPLHHGARLLQARLLIRAWALDDAAADLAALLRTGPDEDAALLLGRARLLQRDYDDALAWADSARAWNPASAGAYLLEADVRFWQRELGAAEAPLARALELDPFDADARFAYGYAIWRRVDATQLDAMAAQWDLALALNPLHYETHWHWGNGHTNLTYADYAHPDDEAVRARLAAVDSLLTAGAVDQALALALQIERDAPTSLLPALARGSIYYMDYEMDAAARLDSAQHIFEALLARKPHYGPAHNGLAAVIKQRQFRQLAPFDSLEAAIAATPLPDDPGFDRVFPDVALYPGDRVEQMVRHQLHKGIVYLPFLVRQDRAFRIPPLHHDLAQAMGRPYFRFSTTFDNRQWMDIRGVGSGAAGIEYVERGSHLERNVVLHEYTHLFHGRIFTDAESRRVRALYHQAMEEDRTLDYYSANNESEYLAQTYTAYFAPVKVHPLNHKSMNTRRDLETKDPALFAFIDSLVARQTAYLEGDTAALAGNWAQVYVNLSELARDGEGPDAPAAEADRPRVAAALLDTALTWDPAYLPAFLSYAALEQSQHHFEAAADWLAGGEAIDAAYAPLFSARAELAEARRRAGKRTAEEALDEQIGYYRTALRLETDLAERAALNKALREQLAAYGDLPSAVETALAYVESAPTLSTYLRDRRDEAWADAALYRSELGYAGEVLDDFGALIAQKPQHFDLRTQYVDALTAAGRYAEAREALEGGQRILAAAGSARPALSVRLAHLHLLEHDLEAARTIVAPLLADSADAGDAGYLFVQVLAELSETAAAFRLLETLTREPAETPAEEAERLFTHGLMREHHADRAAADEAYRAALALNPYHRRARLRLLDLYVDSGRTDDARALVDQADHLDYPLGPGFRDRAEAALQSQE